MQHLNSYTAYGLGICSELECGQLLPGAGNPDVHIRVGSVPEHLADATSRTLLYECGPGRFLLGIANVARYLVTQGKEITIHPAPDADIDAIRLFLCGPALGALLHQRGIFLLHGSAIVTQRGAVVFSGVSGAGKSTIAGAFLRKGYRVLADEVCAIDTTDSLRVIPGNPFLMLWADALRETGIEAAGLQPVRRGLEKYFVPLRDGFASEAVELDSIYIVEANDSKLSYPTPVKGLRKIEALAQNTYRPRLVEEMKFGHRHLNRVAKMAERIPVRRISRPRGSFQLHDLVGLLEKDFAA